MFNDRGRAPASRWISIIFLQGGEADDLLDLIDHSGPAAAIEYLQQWDFGNETVDAALMNGYVYDRIPAGHTDRTVEVFGSPYALTYNASFGYVSLLRRYSADPERTLVTAPRAPVAQSLRARQDVADTWAGSGDRATSKTGHAVSL
ncbi:hypothetical protein [Microterricola viridarii]|uniref:Uncharacterized protein n=1 Tax=Microterricola viridarii TaxID=412690 RepID=A0A1H1VIY4_9MICO|nr:hypothetical protein [Microterricola viridarii]SDS84266.1 hypothetical protein SAMN04489834_2266 [Microterricola viridarii]